MTRGHIRFMEKFNITDTRYSMFFSYDNVYGVFRPRNFVPNRSDSLFYDLIDYKGYDSVSPEDALKDIIFLVRAGKFDLKVNDVIGLRINGFISSYQFCGASKKYEPSSKNFIDIPNFFKREKDDYITYIHERNMVLSVLEGLLYEAEGFDLKRRKVYCIEKEVFGPAERTSGVVSNYSLYTLNGMDIKNVNPHARPFVMINNALYCFHKNRGKDKSSLLLLNKYELEILKDYNELKNMKFVI